MTDKIETTHRDYEIRYIEITQVWECPALHLSAPQLTDLRCKINELAAAARKVARVKALQIDRWRDDKLIPCEITSVADGEPKRCWITVTGSSGRALEYFDSLLLDTAKNREAFAAYQRATAEAMTITKAADALLAAIPRVTAADLRPQATTGAT